MTSSPDDTGWTRWVPALGTIRTYRRAWLRNDVVAGLVLTGLLVPQGMAYAELAGLPAETGLYTTITCLLGYAVFGPSRTLVLGPDSSLAPLIAAVVLPLTVADDPGEAIAYAAVLALLTGAVCIVAGLLSLGSVTDLLSRPVRVGYLNGIALIVLVSQLPKLLGFGIDADGFLAEIWAVAEGVVDGLIYVPALVIGIASLVLILAAKRAWPPFPMVLVAVIATTALAGLLDLAAEGLSVVGPLPEGLPAPSVPSVPLADLGTLAVGAVGIALLAFADTSALSRTFSARSGDRVDPNREAVALGAANIAAGLFQGFPISASSSRTAVAESVGTKSQLTGVVAAVAVLALLLFANTLLADLPSATLAAIVIAASFSLFDVATLRWLVRVRRSDFALSLVATAGVLLLGVLPGLGAAIGLSIAVFVWRTWRPYSAVLGRVQGRKGYHDVSRHPDAARVPGLVIFRFDAPLFFANATYFEEELLEVAGEHPDARRIVVAAEPITDVDSTGAETLERILDELDERGIELAFAELKGPVKDRLQRYGLFDRIGADRFHSTVGTAVSHYLEDEPSVEWEDWTDR